MTEGKRIVIVSASPKPAGSAASDVLAKAAAEALGGGTVDLRVVNARDTFARHTEDEAFRAMAAADALLIVFPLYIFCLPGFTMRFLQRYRDYAAALPARKSAAVYAVVNCGFPEPEINAEAARVVARFATAVGARYRYGILIGGGGIVNLQISPVRKMLAQYREALLRIRTELETGAAAPAENVLIRVGIPRWFYYFMGNLGWRRWYRKNGGKDGDICARPYQP